MKHQVYLRPPARTRALLVSGLLLAANCARPGPEGPPAPVERQHSALSVPPGFAAASVVSGLEDPTAMAFAPDGRLFVCEQRGTLRVISSGQLLAAPFVSLPVDPEGERGLLGVAFDPAFASNRFLYVYYTARTPNVHNRVSRLRASASNPNLVESGSEVVLLDLDRLSGASNHNGGALHFGPDGKLYVASGDNANGDNAQTLGNLLGKMLRLEPDGRVPADNPFVTRTSGRNQAIWALGLRNPFTFAFLPGASRMFINDVGGGAFEEINDGIAGANYGWPETEGPTSQAGFRGPIHSYGHGGGACAITGGAFYAPATATFPADYQGDYLFAEYCANWLRRFDPVTGAVSTLATGLSSPVDIDVGSDGSVYVLSRGTGRVERISASATSSAPPSITRQPEPVQAAVGDTVGFAVEATGSAPLAFQWQRDGVDLGGATSRQLTLSNVQRQDDGARFRAVVTNSAGRAVSDEVVLRVSPGDPPTGVITSPVSESLYRGGQSIAYAAQGSDPEDGALPASAFTFWVDLHHDQHTHPAQAAQTGASQGSFVVPVEGELSANVFYRIYLRVRDSAGLEHTSSVDVLPLIAQVTLASDPPGLRLDLDGAPVTAPVSFEGVAGMVRRIGAPSPQSQDGKSWVFDHWSDGGSAAHAISTPDSDATWVAVFTAATPPPPPPPPPQDIWEAEAAVLSGAVVTSFHPGFTGTGFVDYLRASGDFIEWSVNAPHTGSYDLELRYSNSSASLRPLEMRVNGAVLSTRARFPATSSWTDWRTTRVTATLNAGSNRIRATATNASGPNVDHLRLIPR